MNHRLRIVLLCALAPAAVSGCTSGEAGTPGAGGGSSGPTSSGANTGTQVSGAGAGASGGQGASGGTSADGGSTGAGGRVDVPVVAGEWFEAPDSHMEDVKHAVDGPNMWDVGCVISCWSGGAYDSKRDRLVVWGGGHGQYSGNELYAFSLPTLSWERLDDPSNPPGVDVPYAPDGNPTSRHTYNYLQYLPSIDRFCGLGGTAFYPGGQTGTRNVDCFDFQTNQWEADVSQVPEGATGYAFSAVDPSTGFVYQHGPYGSAQFVRYDPKNAIWTTLSGSSYTGSGYTRTAAFDPKRQKMVAIGDGISIWDVDPSTTTVVETNPQTTGDNSLETAGAVGIDYDPVSETFIAWNGGQSVYSLDVDTMAWTKFAPTGATPGPAEPNGTYGRFRYAPWANVFVVVSASNQNVFVYRNTPDPTAPQWYLDMLSK